MGWNGSNEMVPILVSIWGGEHQVEANHLHEFSCWFEKMGPQLLHQLRLWESPHFSWGFIYQLRVYLSSIPLVAGKNGRFPTQQLRHHPGRDWNPEAFKQLRWMGPNLEVRITWNASTGQFIRDTFYKTKSNEFYTWKKKGSWKNDFPFAMSSFQVKNPIAFEVSSIVQKRCRFSCQKTFCGGSLLCLLPKIFVLSNPHLPRKGPPATSPAYGNGRWRDRPVVTFFCSLAEGCLHQWNLGFLFLDHRDFEW